MHFFIYTVPSFQSEFILIHHLVQLRPGHPDNYKFGRGANSGENGFREINWQLTRFRDPVVIIHALGDTHKLGYRYIRTTKSTY